MISLFSIDQFIQINIISNWFTRQLMSHYTAIVCWLSVESQKLKEPVSPLWSAALQTLWPTLEILQKHFFTPGKPVSFSIHLLFFSLSLSHLAYPPLCLIFFFTLCVPQSLYVPSLQSCSCCNLSRFQSDSACLHCSFIVNLHQIHTMIHHITYISLHGYIFKLLAANYFYMLPLHSLPRNTS